MTETLLITQGDPNGLGPELICRLLSTVSNSDQALVIIGPESALKYYVRKLNIEPFWQQLTSASDLNSLPPGIYCLSPQELSNFTLRPGEALKDGGFAAGLSLSLACELLRSNMSKGLVTCPLNKAKLQEAGYDFPGHTEFLAQNFGLRSDEVCMHLAGPRLKVSLVTTHPPLRDVPDLLNEKRILLCLRLTWELMNSLEKNPQPIAVCGLNPHAGEEGRIGREDVEIISPAVEKAKAEGISAIGPLPADTLFFRASRGEFSSVLAMYHDQGLAPLKLLHFQEAVNITLGLPVIRTSVDHGTGYDLVGKGLADCSSLFSALEMARTLVNASL